MKYLIGFLIICAPPVLHAQGVNPEKLITFSNNLDSDTSSLSLTFYDDSYVKGLHVSISDAGKVTETDYLISYMEITEIPAVMRAGAPILNFQGTVGPEIGSGVLNFRFISSDGRDHQCDVALRRDNQGQWLLIKQNTGQVIADAKLTLKGQFVEGISGICP